MRTGMYICPLEAQAIQCVINVQFGMFFSFCFFQNLSIFTQKANSQTFRRTVSILTRKYERNGLHPLKLQQGPKQITKTKPFQTVGKTNKYVTFDLNLAVDTSMSIRRILCVSSVFRLISISFQFRGLCVCKRMRSIF